MATIKTINKAMASQGIDGELVKGASYFYLSGNSFARCKEQGIYGIYRLNDYTTEQWLEVAMNKIKEVTE